jgi:hypothetical protein
MCFFTKFYALYKEIEENAGPKNDHAMRKSPGHIVWVRVFGPHLYKIESVKESEKWCSNG